MKRRVILASTSPRRKQLLEQIGLQFDIVPSDYEEDMTLPLTPAELVQHLALGKATAVAVRHPEAIVIGADTVVVLEEQVLGKPKSADDAKHTLRRLSGQAHQVFTGVAVLCGQTGYKFKTASISEVRLRELTDAEIADYVASGEPLDKAGSYAVQGKSAVFVAHMSGSYSGVIGLPLLETWQALQTADQS